MSSICVKKVAQTPTQWARKSTRDNKGYHVFLKRLLKVEEGRTARRRWRTRVCQHLSPLPLPPSFTERKVGHFRGAKLAKAREAHQWALVAAIVLEECI